MQATDASWVFGDLERLGLLSTVEVLRGVSTGRNARGHRVTTPTSVGCAKGRITAKRDALLRAGWGESTQQALMIVCLPGTDLAVDDTVEVTCGLRAGQRLRVMDVAGEGPEPVRALLERMS